MKNTNAAAAANLQTVKARLDPRLNEPYFEMTRPSMSCTHAMYGVRLDATAKRAYCRQCGAEIALFDALLNYHQAEQRLVSTLAQIKEARQREINRKQRDKERRPFMRIVTGRRARKDMSLKAEPIIGYELTLECGHKQDQKDTRVMKNVNCHQCRDDGTVAK